MLTGAILHVLYAKEEKSLAAVARLLSDPSRPIERTLYEMLTTNHIGTSDDPQVHPTVAKSARQLFNMSENERSGVVSTANTYLARFAEPIMGEVTSACDWHIGEQTHPRGAL